MNQEGKINYSYSGLKDDSVHVFPEHCDQH
jgi:hypothetical protein